MRRIVRGKRSDINRFVSNSEDASIVKAIEANLRAAYPPRSPRTDVYEGPSQTRTITGVPSLFFNAVVHAEFETGQLDAQIRETLGHFDARNVDTSWWTGPSTRPHDLGAHLEAHGLRHQEDFPGMAMDLGRLNEMGARPSGLVIDHVRDEGALGRFTRTLVDGSGFSMAAAPGILELLSGAGYGGASPWRHYLAYLDGEAVATTSTYRGIGAAGVYLVATLPEARRMGVGTATVLNALYGARQLGCRLAVLQSSAMGCEMYKKIGFKEYCKFGFYVKKVREGATGKPR